MTRDIQEVNRQKRGIRQAFIDDSRYLNGETVTVPTAGADPSFVINRVGESNISERTDGKITYNVNNVSSDAQRIKDRDELRANYGYRQSVARSHSEGYEDKVDTALIHNIVDTATINGVSTPLPAGNLFPTSGAAAGGKLLVTLDDIERIPEALDAANYPETDRHLAFPINMYYQMLRIPAIRDSGAFGEITLPSGKVKTLFGMIIHKFTFLPTYSVASNGATPALQAVGAVVDCRAIIGWHRSAGRMAYGAPRAHVAPTAKGHGIEISADGESGALRQRQDGVYVVYEEKAP